MTTADTFNVTATWDKPNGYTAGDTITGTISGDDVQTVTTTTTGQVGPVIIPVDGSKSTVTLPDPVIVPTQPTSNPAP